MSPLIPVGWWGLIKEAATKWLAHNDSKSGAALAYYSVFSIGPLILIATTIAGIFFGPEAVQTEVSEGMKGLLGEAGTQAVQSMLAGASRPQEGVIATVIGAATLIFAAVNVVVQLKDALNTVWEVNPQAQAGIWNFVRTYVLSLAAVLSGGFLLLVSMLLSAALAAVGKYVAPFLPESGLQLLGSLASFVVVTLLFAMMFKWLPDAEVCWGDVWLGAVLTAGLFELGKLLIALYIGKQGLESTFGAAASIVTILIWVYYSAQIVLMGAEFTRVHARSRGSA